MISEFTADDPVERVINLGETAMTIFTNKNFAFLGVGDSMRNTVAFYPISELVWREKEEKIAEYNAFDLIRDKVKKCKTNFKLVN